MESTIWTYPWDVQDGGTTHVMQTIRDLKLDAVSLATTYHSFDQIRPQLEGPKHLQVGTSAAYYPFDPDQFEGRIQPAAPEWIGTSAWSEAVEAAQTNHLKVVAWTLFFHNSSQVSQHPDLAQIACTGDRSTHHLCPSQPEVVRYATALAADIANHPGISAVECESIAFGGHGHTHFHPKIGIKLGSGGNFLMSLCFCEACVAGGESRGIDVRTLQRAVLSRLEDTFRTGQPTSAAPESLLDELPGLRGFCSYREDTVTDLITQTSAAAQKPIRVIAMGNRHTSGLDPSAIASTVEAVECLCYTPNTERLRRQTQEAAEIVRSADRIGIGIQAYPPATDSADHLVKSVAAVRESGASIVSFYNFGIMPPANLEWIPQALEA